MSETTKPVGELPSEPLTFYDVSIENIRYVTQADFDLLMDRCQVHSIQRRKAKEALESFASVFQPNHYFHY